MKRIFILWAIFMLAGCEADQRDLPSLGTLEGDRIEVVADSSEPILAVHVTEGDTVASGEVLIEQDPERPRARLKRAKARLAEAAAVLEQAEAGPRPEDIKRARANLAAAKSAAQTIKLEWQREQELVEDNYASRNRVDILEGRYEEALARRDEASAMLEELLAGTRSEEIKAARNQYEAALARVEDIELTLQRTTIEAPVAGTVEALPFETGERPKSGQTVVTLIADRALYARVHIPEPLRTRLQPGSTAEIHMDGRDEPYRGRVRWIARQASFTPFFALTQHDRSRLSYLAEIDLVDTMPGDLPIGVPVQVYFPELQTDER